MWSKNIVTAVLLAQMSRTGKSTPIWQTLYNGCTHITRSIHSVFSTQDSPPQSGADKDKKFKVLVEGNIGSGKTALLEHFRDDPFTEILPEPVDRWRNVQGHNALALMYEDPSRWALTLQTYVQLTMLQQHLQPQMSQVQLMERSIFSAKYCFVENLHDSGVMPDIEYCILTQWFDWIVANNSIKVDLIVYLQTSPEVVHRRIIERSKAKGGRKEEAKIPISYLRSLHKLHEDWLVRQTKFPLPAPVLVLNGNEDLPTAVAEYDRHRSAILCGYG